MALDLFAVVVVVVVGNLSSMLLTLEAVTTASRLCFFHLSSFSFFRKELLYLMISFFLSLLT